MQYYEIIFIHGLSIHSYHWLSLSSF